MPCDATRVQELFLAALDRTDPERAAYLDAACGGDAELRARVEALLHAHVSPDSLLDEPVIPAVPTPAGEVGSVSPTVTHDPAATRHFDATAHPSPAGEFGFELGEEVGRGGMAVVYRAIQRGLNRPVAVKMLPPGERTEGRHLARFLAEAEAVAAVEHPHVVRVYGHGECDGRPYLAMELCPGGTLAGRLKAGALPPRAAAELVRKVASGVAAAHALGIVHRDVKPANVLFDAAGEPKVSDFGLARRGGSDLTRTQATMGTPAYMPPEQAGGRAKFVGPPADVWALGVVLYECLTGRVPFEGEHTGEVLDRVREAEPAPPRRHVPSVPRDLELVCLKCLSKEPHDRYPTAAELADDLGRFLGGEPILARPAGWPERAVKWVRRNRLLAGAAAAVALALVTGAAVSLGFAVEAREQAGRAGESAGRERDARLLADQKAEEASNQAARADRETAEAVRARDELQVALARALLAPLNAGDPAAAFSPHEAASFRELASRRSRRLAAAFLEEGTDTPLACRQLESRAEYALHAAVGLDPALRDEADRLLRTRLSDPRTGADRRASLARIVARWGWASPDTADRAAEEVAGSLLRDPNAATIRDDATALAALTGRLKADRAADLCGRVAAALATTAAGTPDATLRRQQAAGLSAVAPRLDPPRAVELLADTLARDPSDELSAALAAAVARVKPGQGEAELARSAKTLVNALAAIPPGPEKAPANLEDVRPSPRAQGLAAVAGRMDADRVVGLLRDAITAAPNTRGRWELVRVLAGVAARLEPNRSAEVLLALMSDTGDPLTLKTLAGDVSAAAARMKPDAAAAACDRGVELLTQHLERAVTPAREPAAKLLAQGLVVAAEARPRDRSSAACTKAADVLIELVAAPTRFLIKEDLANALAAVAVHTDHDRTARLFVEAMRKAKHEASAGGLGRALAAVTPLMKPGRAAETLDEAARLLADAVLAGPAPPVFSGRALAELTRQMDPATALAVAGDALARARTREAREVLQAVVAAAGRRAAQPATPAERAERAAAGEQASRAADALLAGGQPDVQAVRAGTLAAAVGRMDPDEAGRLLADAMDRCKDPALLGPLATMLADVAPRMTPARAADACDSACSSLAEMLGKIGEKASGRGLALGVTAVAARMEPGRAIDALTRAMARTTAPDGMTELLDGLHAAAARAGGAKAAAGYEAAAEAIGRALTKAPNKYAVKIFARLLGVVAGRMPPDKAAAACGVATKALLGDGANPAVSPDLSESLDALELLAPHLSAEATEQLLDRMTKTAAPFTLSRSAGVVAVAAARFGAERAATARRQVAALLAAAADKTAASHEVAALAVGLAAVAERMARGEAAQACDPIARRLLDAMAKDTNYTALAALGRGVTALAPRLEPARGREACEQAAKLLAAAISRTAEQGQLIPLGRTLADVAGGMSTDRAAEVCDLAARKIVSASAVKRPDEVWVAAPVFVALCARSEPVSAALLLADAIARTKNLGTLKELRGGLAAVAERATPAHFARAALDSLADDPAGQKGATRLLWEMSGLAASRDQFVPASAFVVGAFALPPGVLSGLAAAHVHLPRHRPLPPKTLTDLLKHPFCVGEFRRDVLDALGTTYGRQFADQWEFVEYVRANAIPLDLLSPPEAPKGGVK